MKLATVNELIKVCNAYDAFTCFIDSYQAEREAKSRNSRLDNRFDEILQAEGWKGYNRGIPNHLTNMTPKKLEYELRAWLWEHEINIDDDDIVMRDNIYGIIRTYDGRPDFIPFFD